MNEAANESVGLMEQWSAPQLRGRFTSSAVMLAILNDLAGGRKSEWEVFAQDTNQLREALAGANPTGLEALLAERIVVCHLALARAEMQVDPNDFGRARMVMELVVTQHQARYLHAVQALARVRRDQLPRVTQVNMGLQQVNVANIESLPGSQPTVAGSSRNPEQELS